MRFLLSGAVNTVFGYSVFAALVFAGLGAQPALIITFCVGVLFNYVTSSRFVFQKLANRWIFVRFIGAYVLTYFLNAILLELFMQILKLSPYSAQVLLMPLSALLTFVLMRDWVFKTREAS